jgi:hypothetical protein
MQQTPITDKSVGIGHSQWGIGDEKFREVRQKAQEERQELKHRAKKDKTVAVPEYGPGKHVVTAVGYQTRHYRLIEVVDFNESGIVGRYMYFGILLRTTDKHDLPRIGRLCTFNGLWRQGKEVLAGIEEKDVKWLDEQ